MKYWIRMRNKAPAPFAFVIDTEEYAGNFERELCAYVTGIIGECGVGEEQAGQFRHALPGENPFEDIVEQVPDEHGCHRPVSIWPTPGWFNNGYGGEFRENDPDAPSKAQNHLRQECLKESKEKPYAKKEHNDKHRRECEEESKKKFKKHPAYRSVAIFFSEKPSAELIYLIKKRSEEYCGENNIKIIGFRLLKLSTREEGIDIS